MRAAPINIVWFKRDLRLVDHAPLAAAARAGTVLPLVVVEPGYWRLPDTSARQWRFQSGCIAELADAIATRGGRLVVRIGTITEVLSALRREVGPFTLWSHEETGNAWTHARDRSVRGWMRAHGDLWHEMPQFGVVRGPRLDRDRWAAGWDRMMAQPLTHLPASVAWRAVATDALPDADGLGLADDGLLRLQPPGRVAGLAALGSFLACRGQRYTHGMSSPLTAEAACSRLSPHLAYGTVSMREAAQAAWARAAALRNDPTPGAELWRQALRSFIARLHWHCHFIQKLEAEPAAEHRPFARTCEGLRPNPGDPVRLAAWASGQTGFPFVDAAMRYLVAHGWINFRMRAMLMSFAAYDLWLPWQQSGLVLARNFTDYEPGIHWPQCQMQSGETGTNTVRIYAPVKQGCDHDPTGDFVRRWVPELARVPTAVIHAPWQLDPAARRALCPDYPPPLVDHTEAARTAMDRILQLRRDPGARAEADAVQRRHGSRRKTALAIRRPQAAAGQRSFGF